ncbi:MAG: phospholipid carrier-dependent glycosyltransferase [Acidobacteriota bacterium]
MRFLTLWLLVVVVVLSIGLGAFPLLDPDEGRNAEVGREMALTNDYVMPRLDALPYLDKPIVYFAAEAAAMEILGPTELAARLPAFLFTLATAAFVAWFARRVWGPREAMIAPIVTLATPLTIAFSRTVIFDSALAFFITVAMGCFYLAIEGAPASSPAGPPPSRRRDAAGPAGGTPALHTVLAWAAIGFGVITKGPVAIALPLLVAIPYAIWRKRAGAIWSLKGLIVFVLVIAPWVWAISRAVPDFLHYVVVTETAERVATKALKRTGPPWYFVPFLIFGALPWSVVVIAGHTARPRDRETPQPTLYLLLWLLIPFLFFSLSQSKRPQYILPLMPAIALLASRVWCESARARRWAGGVMMAFGAALVAAPWFVRLRPEYGEAARTSALILGILALAGGALAMVPWRYVALAGITVPVIAIPMAANPVVNAIATRRSTAAFVAQLRPHIGPDTEIVGVEAYTGSMSFYLRRPIVVVTPDGEEFTSNYIIRHYSRFAGSATLKPPSWLGSAYDGDKVFIVRAGDTAHRAQLEGRGLRAVAVSARYVAYASRMR